MSTGETVAFVVGLLWAMFAVGVCVGIVGTNGRRP